MSGNTAIEWSDKVWNPLAGCERVSPGCLHCYAFELHDRRYALNLKAAKHALVDLDAVGLAVGTAARHAAVKARELGARLPFPPQYDVPFSRVQLLPERLFAPLHWRKPQRIFVNSMSDLFHEDVPDGYIVAVFFTMRRAWWHTFQVLTKRPARMRDFVTRWNDLTGEDHSAFIGARGPDATRAAHPSGRGQLFAAYLDWLGSTTGGKPPEGAAWPTFDWMEGPMRWGRRPLLNVCLGTSVEDQQRANVRFPMVCELGEVGWNTMVSLEPLLGPVVIPERYLALGRRAWAVVGGESGPKRREMQLSWLTAITEQCRAAEVPVFVKQDSGLRPGKQGRIPEDVWALKQFPEVGRG